jgi:glycosyltransferase involved in cell wall biosynthesis
VASLRTWEPNYRIDLIVRAFALLRAGGPALLHLFGGGAQEPALRALVAELGVGASVVWHGWMAPADLARALASCHVSVSVPISDATSVSLLESMACGLPVVVSDLPANRQWVTAQGGEFVSGKDAHELAEVLADLRGDPARCARLGAHNHALAQVRGSTAAQMDRMARLYRELPGVGIADGGAQ